MPQSTQLTFSQRELTELLLNHQGITDGHWELGVAFHITTGSITLGDTNPAPTIALQTVGYNLVQVKEPTPLSVDASALFPASLPSEVTV